MYKVALITEEQASKLKGQKYDDNSFYNPIQDYDDNWVVSIEEVEKTDTSWLKEAELIDYKPKAFDWELMAKKGKP